MLHATLVHAQLVIPVLRNVPHPRKRLITGFLDDLQVANLQKNKTNHESNIAIKNELHTSLFATARQVLNMCTLSCFGLVLCVPRHCIALQYAVEYDVGRVSVNFSSTWMPETVKYGISNLTLMGAFQESFSSTSTDGKPK
jgi:hypothetical protein